jgi:hypothetical protein
LQLRLSWEVCWCTRALLVLLLLLRAAQAGMHQ